MNFKINLLLIIIFSINIVNLNAKEINYNILWRNTIENGASDAKQEQKLLFFYLYAKWCPQCKRMSNSVYTNKKVIENLNNYIPIKIDIDKQIKIAKKLDGLPRKYGGSGVPAILIMDLSGNILFKHHGYINAEQLTLMLKKTNQSFQPTASAAG